MIPLFSLTAQKVRFTGTGRLFDRPQAVYQMLFDRQGLRFEQSPKASRFLDGCARAGLPCRGMFPASLSVVFCLLRR